MPAMLIRRPINMFRCTKRKALTAQLSRYRQVIIWGTGSSGRTVHSQLGDRINCFVDSYSNETELFGIPVHKPEYLRNLGSETIVIIASIAFREIQAWLEREAPDVVFATMLELITDPLPRHTEMERLKIDLLSYHNESWFRTWLAQPQLSVNITFRICRALLSGNSFWQRALLVPARIWHTLNCAFFSVELPVTVKAGAGLQFVHYGGIVLHENATLGEFCRICQNVTLGADRRGQVPVLGNSVTMWPGSVAIGGCKLGDFTQVGANSVCLGDIDVADVSLAGSPARPVGIRKPSNKAGVSHD